MCDIITNTYTSFNGSFAEHQTKAALKLDNG